MSNMQPPKPGGMGGPPKPGSPMGSTLHAPKAGGGSKTKFPQPKTKAPSPRALLAVFLLLVLVACISVYLTPSPFTNPDVSVGPIIGALFGLFGCTIIFGVYRFIVDQQHEANSFSEWNFPVSRGRMAQVFTVIGWTAGAINCYLISYEIARGLVTN